ncbi:hypothetical protein HN695_05140 [Candidatus Woesearchaeota archaeon]|nr:hypothetical protein [Candidatus Woesearchaeota archaeon]MBT5272516.1 hypothetical protein [Candidatus Woesearchaeota archaeon]MBT6041476.1 hypothetical protein [Candidatus Woesearchaeota archaeon]MBT6336378.1 hypothetical protein [Candidatus Woesearchaeota archaeon]MBT7927699.1 hypothetical protein [Candidatus Woesearchaeota archaeon]
MFAKKIRLFLRGQAKDRYYELGKPILNSFFRVKDILKENPHYGNPIAKKLIPKSLKRIGIKRLFRVELSNYWRLLYTIEGTEAEIYVFVLYIVDHKEYNKLFGYKNR